MATLIKPGEKPVTVILENGEEDIKKYLECPYPEEIPLGNDPKKRIDRTAWVVDERDELPVNKEAQAIIEAFTAPTEEARTHRMFAADEHGKHVQVDTKIDTISEYPTMRGPVIITNLDEDAL